MSLFSSISTSESNILGSELALLRKLKGFGDKKLLTSGTLGLSLSFLVSMSLSVTGGGEWVKERADWGDTAGDIIRRKFTGLQGV